MKTSPEFYLIIVAFILSAILVSFNDKKENTLFSSTFTREGHKFIKFTEGGKEFSVVHDPDCKYSSDTTEKVFKGFGVPKK